MMPTSHVQHDSPFEQDTSFPSFGFKADDENSIPKPDSQSSNTQVARENNFTTMMSRGLQGESLEPWEYLSMDNPPSNYSSPKLTEMRPDQNYQYGHRNRSADELSKYNRYNAPQPQVFFRNQYSSHASDSGGYTRARSDYPPSMQHGISNPKLRKQPVGMSFPLSNPGDNGHLFPPVLDSYNNYPHAVGHHGQGQPRQFSNPEHMGNRSIAAREQRSVTDPEMNGMFARPKYPNRGQVNQIQKKYPPTTTSSAFMNSSGFGKRAASPQIPGPSTPRSQSPLVYQRSSSVPLEKVMMGSSLCSLEPGPMAQTYFTGQYNLERTSSDLAAYAKVQEYQKFERQGFAANKPFHNTRVGNMSFGPAKPSIPAKYNWKPRSIKGRSTRPNSEVDMFPMPVAPPSPKEPALAGDPEFNFSNLPVLTLTNPLDQTTEDSNNEVMDSSITGFPSQRMSDQDLACLSLSIPFDDICDDPKNAKSASSKPFTASRLSSSFNAIRKSILSRTHSISSNTKDRLSSKKTSSDGHSQVADVNLDPEDISIVEANQIPTLDPSPKPSPSRNSIGLALSRSFDQSVSDPNSEQRMPDTKVDMADASATNISGTIRMVLTPSRVTSVKSNKSTSQSTRDMSQINSQHPERPASSPLKDIVWYKDGGLMEAVQDGPINRNMIFKKPHIKRRERLKQSYHVTKRTIQARCSLKKKIMKSKWQNIKKKREEKFTREDDGTEKTRNLCTKIARTLSMFVWTLRACNPKYGDNTSVGP